MELIRVGRVCVCHMAICMTQDSRKENFECERRNLQNCRLIRVKSVQFEMIIIFRFSKDQSVLSII